MIYASGAVVEHDSAATLPGRLLFDWNSDLYGHMTIVGDVQIIEYWAGNADGQGRPINRSYRHQPGEAPAPVAPSRIEHRDRVGPMDAESWCSDPTGFLKD